MNPENEPYRHVRMAGVSVEKKLAAKTGNVNLAYMMHLVDVVKVRVPQMASDHETGLAKGTNHVKEGASQYQIMEVPFLTSRVRQSPSQIAGQRNWRSELMVKTHAQRTSERKILRSRGVGTQYEQADAAPLVSGLGRCLLTQTISSTFD